MTELTPQFTDDIPHAAPSDGSHRLVAWVGGIALAAGAIVIAGWFIHADLLIRLGRNLPPMRFNTALGFVFLGLAFLMSARNWTAPRQVLGVLLVALAVVTLLQFVSGADFGIDQLFMHDYLPPEQGKFPGRMSPATAVGFLLTTVALLLADSRHDRIRATLAPLLALLSTAQASAVLLNFSLGFGTLFTHQVYAGMALHTAALHCLLGGALLYRLWQNRSIGLPRWLPLAAGIATLSAVLVVWQALKAQEQAGVQHLLDRQAISVEADIRRAIDQNARALHRMAQRWMARGGTPRGEWQIEAADYVADITGLTRIDWVDASGRLRWTAPANAPGGREGSAFAAADWFRQALQPGAAAHEVFMSAGQRLEHGPTEFFLTARLSNPDRNDGMLRGVFDAQVLIDTLLQDHFGGELALEIRDPAGEIFSNIGPGVDRNGLSSVRSLELHGRRWDLQMFVGPKLVQRAHTLLPVAVLFGGIVMALLLTLAIHASITASNQRALVVSREARLRESEAKYRQLLESMLDGMFVAQDEHFVFANPALVAMLGYGSEEFAGLGFDRVVAPSHLSLWLERYRLRMGTGPEPERQYEVPFMLRDSDRTIWVEIHVRRILFNGRRAVQGTVRDISDQREAAAKLAASEARLRGALALQTAIFNSASVSIIATDGNGLITAFNLAAERMLGYRAEEMINRETPAILHDPDEVHARAESLSIELGKVIAPGFEVFVAKARTGYPEEREWTYVRKDGTRLPVLLSVTPITDPQGGITGFLGIASDITERQAQEQRDRAALKEKEMLLKEIYHRVKNNLQVIQSLLNLQGRTLPDIAARDAMKETANRIHAMALVHEKLYRSGDLAAVNLAEYVGDLLNQMDNSTSAASRKIKLYHDIHSTDVGIDIAIPFGLLLNEMVSNSLKHAFPDDRGGEVRVTLEAEGRGAVLTVADNGVGIKSEVDLNNSPSMGYKLIRSLTAQLRGKLSFENAPGAKFTIHFPEWG